MEGVVGKVGRIVVRVPGSHLPGEVLLTLGGIDELFIAHGREALPIGRSVLIVHDRGGRAVDVESWTDVDQER